MQSKIIETPVPDSVAVHNATNATRDLESEFEAGQEGKIREIVMDNVDSEPVVCNLANYVDFLAFVLVHGKYVGMLSAMFFGNMENISYQIWGLQICIKDTHLYISLFPLNLDMMHSVN